MIRPKRRSPRRLGSSDELQQDHEQSNNNNSNSNNNTPHYRWPPPPRRSSSLTIPSGGVKPRIINNSSNNIMNSGSNSSNSNGGCPMKKQHARRASRKSDWRKQQQQQQRRRHGRRWRIVPMLFLYICLFGGSFVVTYFARSLYEQQEQQQQQHIVLSSSNTDPAQQHAQEKQKQETPLQQQPQSLPRFQTHFPHLPPCNNNNHEPITAASFTLVTHCSVDRMWMMKHHCDRWKNGPVSVVIWANDNNKDSLVILSQLERHCPHHAHQHTLHAQIMTPATLFPHNNTISRKNDKIDYPVNHLRNLALSAVQTSHVVLLDIDFWPASDLAGLLARNGEVWERDPQTALVLPAFSLQRQCKEWRECPDQNIPLMPHTTAELFDLVTTHQVAAFDPTNVGGHGSTRYNDWIDQGVDDLLPIECVLSNRYEPYLAFPFCRDVPPFQEAFSGYGKNKMTWVMHMRRSGWQLQQVGQAFVIHYPHLDSPSRMRWNGGKNGEQLRRPKGDANVDWLSYKRGRVDQTFVEFREWLDHNVPDRTRVPLCSNALNDDERLWIDRTQLKSRLT